MTQQQSNPKLRTLPASSAYSPTCRECSDTGFIPTKGGVVRCECLRRQHPRPANPAPAPAPVSFGPPARAGNHRQKILALLRAAGPTGVLNTVLYEKVCKRPPSRIFELRQEGHVIKTFREGESLYRFVLVREASTVKEIRVYEPRKGAVGTPSLFAGVGR